MKFALVAPAPARVKFGGLFFLFMIQPLTYGLYLEAESRHALWLYGQLVKPCGVFSWIIKPFCYTALYSALDAQIRASLPDPAKAQASDALSKKETASIAEFLPRLCLIYGWTTEDVKKMTIRDLVFYYQVGIHDQVEKHNHQIILNGGKPPPPPVLSLDSRWANLSSEPQALPVALFMKAAGVVFKGANDG